MKKIILIFVLVMLNVVSFGQSVVKDITKDNVRTIETSGITARSFTDRVVWNFGLEAHKSINNDSVQYILIINLNTMKEIPISDKGIFLIKTFDDNILELTNLYTNHNTVTLGYSYHYPIIGNIGTISSNNLHRNIAYYIITENQLKMLKNGIKKVRVETDNGYQEKEYEKDKCGKFLFKSYEIISQNMHKIRTKSIKENF